VHESNNQNHRVVRIVPLIVESVDQDELLQPRAAAILFSDLLGKFVWSIPKPQPFLVFFVLRYSNPSFMKFKSRRSNSYCSMLLRSLVSSLSSELRKVKKPLPPPLRNCLIQYRPHETSNQGVEWLLTHATIPVG